MDHLVLSRDIFEYPEVPYLQDPATPFVYDNGEHPKYPQRVGWSWPEIKEIAQKRPSEVEGHTLERAASLVQAWLYFGLIHAITRLPVDTSQYVRRNAQGKLVVTSKPLLDHLQLWQKELVGQEDRGANLIAQIDQLFKIYHYFLSHVAVVWKDLLPREVGASIVVLHQTLALAKLSMFPNSYAPPSLCNFHDYFHKQIRAPLVDDGWCKATVHRLGQRLSPVTLYHMASISNVLPAKSESHVACSNLQCQAWRPPVGAFKPQHAVVNCECRLMPSVQDQVTAIVEKRCIPLLSFSADTGISIKSLDVTSPGASKDYVAISHVWADGLGNPSDNTMYRCQLELLQDRVTRVWKSHNQAEGYIPNSNPVLFWIDTLCVPAKESEIKSIALAMMEDTYREASIVLVIDAGLKSLSTTTTSPFQLAISIAASKWWTRLWTLQEGVFAKALYFQCFDTARSPADVIQRSHNHYSTLPGAPPWDMETMFVRDALSEMQELSLSKLRSNSGRHILDQVSWRFTTRQADETICLAILLKLSVSTLAQLDPDPRVRMRAFILMQRFFPTAVLFGRGNYEEHFEDEGFRWAPCSFLTRTAGPSAYENLFDPRWTGKEESVETAYADERGLHVQTFGFRLDLRNFGEKNPKNPTVCLVLDGPQQGAYTLSLLGRNTWDVVVSWGKPLFLILPRPLDVGSRALAGVLVTKSEVLGGTESAIACRYEDRVAVYLGERHLTGDPYTEYLFGAGVPDAIQATVLDEKQEWCVR